MRRGENSTHKNGVDLTPSQVLEDALQSSDLGVVADCADIFTLLVPLYRGGMD